jgi:hypothetical protein
MIGSERPDDERKDASSKSESQFMHGCKFMLRKNGFVREQNKMQEKRTHDSKRIIEGIPKSMNRQHSDIKR